MFFGYHPDAFWEPEGSCPSPEDTNKTDQKTEATTAEFPKKETTVENGGVPTKETLDSIVNSMLPGL